MNHAHATQTEMCETNTFKRNWVPRTWARDTQDIWALRGRFLRPFGAAVEVPLGCSLRLLSGCSWGPLGCSWVLLGCSWGALGVLLGCSWVLVGCSWCSWGAVGVFLGALGMLLGCSWDALGVLLGAVYVCVKTQKKHNNYHRSPTEAQ